MNYPYLLSEILRGAWMIDAQTSLSFAPFLLQLSEGKALKDLAEEKSAFQSIIITSKGNELIVSAENNNSEGNIYDQIPEGSIAIISLSGTMLKQGTMCSWGTMEIAQKLIEAHNHPNISGIIFDVDSGGGSVNSIAPLAEFMSKKTKPVVGLGDTVASAALYMLAGANHIMASNTISSGFGSVGVVASWMDVQPYYEKMGVKFHTVYADQSEHKNQAFEMALKGEYDLIKKEMLNPMAIAFQEHMKAMRGSKLNMEVPGLLTGKMFFAKDALECGLIDSIGDKAKAIQKVLELADINKFLNS